MLNPTQLMSPATPLRSSYRWTVLALLLVVYALNFVDRQIIGILAIPIKRELALTDTQLGALGGVAFALFYAALGIPVAWLADRKSRSWIVTISLTLWSLFTALCGTATGFWQLFLYRMGVGVGEAGGVAPSFALITDYFPKHQRARAFAVYSFGIPIGSATGILLGGWIANAVDWRTAFVVVGLAGVLFAPIFRMAVREPARGGQDDHTPAPQAGTSFGQIVRLLAGKRSFWLIAFASSFASMVNYGLLFWLPAFFGRSFGLDLVQISMFYGSLVLVGGLIGIWCGGWLGDRFGASNPAAYVLLPACAFVLVVPLYAIGLLSQSLLVAFILLLPPSALAYLWIGPVITSIQHLVPPEMRATASACFLFINNLIGIGFGSLLFGYLADVLGAQFGSQSLKYSILFGLSIYVLSAALFALASRHIRRDSHC